MPRNMMDAQEAAKSIQQESEPQYGRLRKIKG